MMMISYRHLLVKFKDFPQFTGKFRFSLSPIFHSLKSITIRLELILCGEDKVEQKRTCSVCW